ncbi:MAG: hypothetical protein WKF77_27600, partial [Planctomycetaceae bacterium]
MRIAWTLTLCVASVCSATHSAKAELKAGAAVVDITPLQFPVLVNGGMTSRSAEKAVAPLYARSIVLDNGTE